jgi:hypothetical protein
MKDPREMTLDEIADALNGQDLVVSLSKEVRKEDGTTHINKMILERISYRLREISNQINGGAQ